MAKQTTLKTDFLFIHHSLSNEPSAKYDLHCHNYAEVFLLISGKVRYLVEGREYQPVPLSVLLIPPGVFHGVQILTDQSYDRYALHFLPELISGDLRDILLKPFSSGGAYFALCSDYRFVEFFDALLACRLLPEELQGAAIRPRTESLLVQVNALNTIADLPAAGESVDETARALIDYVNREFQRPLMLDELSGRFFISKNQLNRVFRKATGTTVMNYINHKRVTLARQLMLSGVAAQEAAARVGFGDYSSFFRQYRKIMGHAPTQAGQHAIL